MCKSEFLIYHGENIISFIQIRGSVPGSKKFILVFWEQTGVQVGGHKLKISRGPESTKLACQKHFESLIDNYGNVNIVNLLNQAPLSAELTLTVIYFHMILGYV
jgi:hypothetical protein